MIRNLLNRLGIGVGLVFAVVTATFFLINLTPGDPARLWVGPGAGAEELEAARRALGLDRPLPARYAMWLGDFIRGEWGTSLVQSRPVRAVIRDALPFTLLLSGASLLVTYLAGILVGGFQAARHRSTWDGSLTAMSLFVYGMPAYWLASMLVLIFAYVAARQGWPVWLRLPAMGASSLDADFLSGWSRVVDMARHLVLPLTTLGLIGAAGIARFVRASVLDVQRAPFVLAARARGVPRPAIGWRYILRNALTPVLTLLGLSLPALFSGTVFVEVIFAWPGMGREIVGAVAGRDYPLVMATTAIFAMLVVAGNMIADVMTAVADPRQRDPHP